VAPLANLAQLADPSANPARWAAMPAKPTPCVGKFGSIGNVAAPFVALLANLAQPANLSANSALWAAPSAKLALWAPFAKSALFTAPSANLAEPADLSANLASSICKFVKISPIHWQIWRCCLSWLYLWLRWQIWLSRSIRQQIWLHVLKKKNLALLVKLAPFVAPSVNLAQSEFVAPLVNLAKSEDPSANLAPGVCWQIWLHLLANLALLAPSAKSAPSYGKVCSIGSIGSVNSMVGDKEQTTKTNNNKPDEGG
jgi:hypothetical protein